MDQISRRGSRFNYKMDQDSLHMAVNSLVYGYQITVQVRNQPPTLAWFHMC